MAKRASRRRSSGTKEQRPTCREVIAFIEKFLRVPDGPDAGKPLILSPWQQHEVCRIYDNPAGTRRAIISTARKNAKTTLAGRWCLITCVDRPHVAGRTRVCIRARSRATRPR
jgi:phage terminase large subunit-like protein